AFRKGGEGGCRECSASRLSAYLALSPPFVFAELAVGGLRLATPRMLGPVRDLGRPERERQTGQPPAFGPALPPWGPPGCSIRIDVGFPVSARSCFDRRPAARAPAPPANAQEGTHHRL